MADDDDNETVLYEVNLDADAAIEGPFETWLRDHVADVLQFDGFLSAEILDDASVPPPGRIRRIVQYRLRDQAALEPFIQGWWGYYRLAEDRKPIFRLEGWGVRRHIRKCFWLRWHDARGRANALR